MYRTIYEVHSTANIGLGPPSERTPVPTSSPDCQRPSFPSPQPPGSQNYLLHQVGTSSPGSYDLHHTHQRNFARASTPKRRIGFLLTHRDQAPWSVQLSGGILKWRFAKLAAGGPPFGYAVMSVLVAARARAVDWRASSREMSVDD